jgi:hypothetical protein
LNNFYKPLDFTKYFERVVDWNATARNGKHDFSQKAKDFQLTLVQEEIKEFFDAVETNNKVLALDGLCDTFVTASYLYFQQKGGENIKPLIIKSPNDNIDYVRSLKLSMQTLEIGFPGPEGLDALDVLKTTCTLLYNFDGCTTKALEEVLDSNDSKFPKVYNVKGMDIFYDLNGNETDPEVECRQIERRSEGRYAGVNYIIVGEGSDRRFIFKSDKGKIVKPYSFFEPNLAQFC